MSLPVRSSDEIIPPPEHSAFELEQAQVDLNTTREQSLLTTVPSDLITSPPSSMAASPTATNAMKRSSPDSIDVLPAKKAAKLDPAAENDITPSTRSSNRASTADIGSTAAKKATKRTPVKPKVPPSPAKDRPRRNVKAPSRFKDEEFKEPPKPATPAKGASIVFDPVYATTNSHSRLVKADVYHMLCLESAWTTLSASEQDTLLAMLPPTATNDSLRAEIAAGAPSVARPKELAEGRPIFRTDVAKFQTDLSLGHLAKSWQAHAQQAVIDRAEGRFDEWKAREAERWWGEHA